MVAFIGRWLIRDSQNTEDEAVRRAWGRLCAAAGIFFNLCLAAVKAAAGVFTGSMAITADAANNISDMISSVITLAGFKLAGQKPDREHPFGHARYEYIAGMVLSILIILVGFEMMRDSFLKILHPAPVTLNPYVLGILVLCVLVKFYMFLYNRQVGKKISSTVLDAASRDSLNDCAATGTVIASTLIGMYTDLRVDGIFGMGLSLFIMWSGLSSLIETMNPLIGVKPDSSFVDAVEKIVGEYIGKGILDMHDLIVHNYGPGHIMISLHVEVPVHGTLMEVHSLVDEIEHRLRQELHCEAVIHADPVDLNDPQTIALKLQVEKLIAGMEGDVRFHDFRTIPKSGAPKIMFDVVVPFQYPMTDQQIEKDLTEKLQKISPGSELDIEIDKE